MLDLIFSLLILPLKRLIGELAGLVGEARQFSYHNQDISQAGRGQPAKYPLFFRVCSKIGSSDIIKSHQIQIFFIICA